MSEWFHKFLTKKNKLETSVSTLEIVIGLLFLIRRINLYINSFSTQEAKNWNYNKNKIHFI